MPSKTEEYLALAQRTANGLTRYQTQPDRKLRAKALAKEYGIGGHSHDFLDGSRGFVNHDWKGLEFDHYPNHQKITLKWAQVEKYIDLMIQSDRYLTDEEKEQRTARQEAERQLPMLDGTVAAEYTALKEQYHGQQGQHRPQAHGRTSRFAGCHPSAQQCV